MAKFDRSKIKGAKRSVVEKRDKEVSEKVVDRNNPDRADYFKIQDGKNIFRVCPPHSDEYPAFEVKVVSWLPQVIEKNGKSTVAPRPMFNAKIHGVGQEKDIVEEYVDYIKAKLEDEIQDDDEIRKRMGALLGRKVNGQWKSGILPSVAYVAYTFRGDELGRLSLSKAQMRRTDQLSIDEEADSPILVDLFSDPNEGFSLIINYDRKKDKSERYSITRGIRPNVISDEKLERWFNMKPLAEMFRGVYTTDTFDKVVSGLQMIDEDEGYNAWNDQEWIDIVDKIRAGVPEPDEEKDENESEEEEKKEVKRGQTNGRTAKISESSNKNGDKLDEMDKDALIDFIADSELDIIVSKRHSESAIRKMIRLNLAQADGKTDGGKVESTSSRGANPFAKVGKKYEKR